MSTSTSTAEVTRSAPESVPEDSQRRERHLSQLAEARKKAVAKNRETRKRKEERMRELEEKVSKVEREKQEDTDCDAAPVVVTKRVRREVDDTQGPPKNFASGLSMDLLRGLAAGGLSLLSLYLSRRMTSSVPAAPPRAPETMPPPRAPMPVSPEVASVTRGPPRPTGSPFVAPSSSTVLHKSGFVAV